MSLGKIGPFDVSKDNWDLFVDRLEQYFIVNDIKPPLKVPTLITAIGSEAYELMVNLCVPVKPSTKSYDDLVKVMQGHLQPKPSLLAERYKFRQRVQRRDESIADYITELKKLSKDCRFQGKTLTENLRDQFVCGLASDAIRQRLFTEEDIKLQRALHIAGSMEAAETDAAMVDNRAKGMSGASGLHQMAPTSSTRQDRFGGGRSARTDRSSIVIHGPRQPARPSGGGPSGTSGAGSGKSGEMNRSTTTKNGKCEVCGGNHSTNTCKFSMYVCRVCNREGHLKKMCPKLRSGTTTRMYNVLEEEVVYEDSDGGLSDESGGGGGQEECGGAGGCTCWSPAPPAHAPHPLRALDEMPPPLLRSNPLYTEEEEQEVVIIVDSLEDSVVEVAEPPRVPRRAPSTSSGYGSGGGSHGRVSPHLPKNEVFVEPRLAGADQHAGSQSASTSDSDASPDCTLSRSLKEDIRACLGGCRWEKDVGDVVEAAVRGAGGITAARARLHAALLALHEPISRVPNRGPSLPYCGPGVRPGDVTMMPKTTEMSLLAASALFTLDGARGEALSRRLARDERRRRRCKIVLVIIALLLLLAAVCAVELLMSRGQRVFGAVLR